MEGKVHVYHVDQGKPQTAQTPGMLREEVISTPNSWVGLVSAEPDFTSGWHHHGGYDTYVYVISGQIKMEFGKYGKDSCVAKIGEVLHIPKNTIHRESNPGNDKQLLFAVRVGQGDPVTNVDGPEE
jgi:uncharacterized RmlC-like cupin family protein